MADAFGIPAGERAAMQRDAGPTSSKGIGIVTIVKIVLVIFVLLILLAQCGDDGGGGSRCNEVRQAFGANSNEYQQCLAQQGSSGSSGRTSGGSYGGGGSGGHK